MIGGISDQPIRTRAAPFRTVGILAVTVHGQLCCVAMRPCPCPRSMPRTESLVHRNAKNHSQSLGPRRILFLGSYKATVLILGRRDTSPNLGNLSLKAGNGFGDNCSKIQLREVIPPHPLSCHTLGSHSWEAVPTHLQQKTWSGHLWSLVH